MILEEQESHESDFEYILRIDQQEQIHNMKHHPRLDTGSILGAAFQKGYS